MTEDTATHARTEPPAGSARQTICTVRVLPDRFWEPTFHTTGVALLLTDEQRRLAGVEWATVSDVQHVDHGWLAAEVHDLTGRLVAGCLRLTLDQFQRISDLPHGRNYGWVASMADAEAIILGDECDLFEDGYYRYAVAETVEPGLGGAGGPVGESMWFEAIYPDDHRDIGRRRAEARAAAIDAALRLGADPDEVEFPPTVVRPRVVRCPRPDRVTRTAPFGLA